MDTKRTMRQVGVVAGLAALLGVGLLATAQPASADNGRFYRNDHRVQNEVRHEERAWDYKFNRDYRHDRRVDHRYPVRADGWYDAFGVFHFYDGCR